MKDAIFWKILGIPMPPRLSDLGKSELWSKLPAVLRFRHVGFVLEIQYSLDLEDPANYDQINGRCTFAVTSDGARLWVNLRSPGLEVLQEERGVVDEIGLTLDDLLSAEWQTLRR